MALKAAEFVYWTLLLDTPPRLGLIVPLLASSDSPPPTSAGSGGERSGADSNR